MLRYRFGNHKDPLPGIAITDWRHELALIRYHWDTAFAVEFLLLALSAPLLYMPQRAGMTGVILGLCLLVTGWIWRRWRIGVWYRATPADWPIFLLLGVMLPVAVWAAPESLRQEYAWPKALVLLWNFQFFTVIVGHLSRKGRLIWPTILILISIVLVFALVAPLGTAWLFKLPGIEPILSRLPSMLGVLSREGGSGFHPNIVAGALLYGLPLMIALSVAGLYRRHHGVGIWLLVTATCYVLGVFLLLQSRGGYIGLAAALVAMVAIRSRPGRCLLVVCVIGILGIATIWGGPLLSLLADNPTIESVGGVATLGNFRVDLWSAALKAMADFPFTGVGLGIFQEVVTLLYPLDIPPDYYFGHAHNFWLQGAMDFGIPGLVMITAIYLIVIVQIRSLWLTPCAPQIPGLVTGLIGCLVAQSVFSLTDSISMGSTPNLLFWGLVALVLALANLSAWSLRQDRTVGTTYGVQDGELV